MNILAFWGKTASRNGDAGPAYKPVLHHLFDVAAAALRLQQISASRTARDAETLGVSPEALAPISAFLAGLHDIGKFSRSFQCKVPELWPVDALGSYPGPIFDRGHWRNSTILLNAAELRPLLCPLFPNLPDADQRSVIWAAIAGHHGRPPSHEEFSCRKEFVHTRHNKAQIGPEALAAAAEAIRMLAERIGPEPVERLEDMEQAKAWSWRLAGLTNLADWVGSDQAYFGFRDLETPIADYWEWALGQADIAIRAKGLAPAPPRPGAGFRAVAPDIQRPTPMQLAADALALPDGPALVLVEDTTGSGKTEAGLTLASRMIEAGKGEGLYFALPTMATANAMYDRLAILHRRLFAGDAAPSLVLAHGRAGFAQPFAESVGTAASAQPGEETAAWCSEWIADSRRKAFFADVGAGTIDQAFLAVLKKKFLTLRQYGLAGRILLVDEAHAFDSYMFRELERLLAMQARLGGSAIVLSATLPEDLRRRMAAAFLDGLGRPSAATLRSNHYPLLTSVGRSGIGETEVGFDERLRRTVEVERLPDRDAAHAAALEAAGRGAAVLVIRNAVDEAVASHAALTDAGAQAQLFHARFALCDRQRIERDVLDRFGRDAAPDIRSGHVLVATQVVEQSLDLDFDLIISDLAPIDLITQRAGRLWRHMNRRPAETRAVPGPRILVISPDAAEATSEKWLEPALGGGAFVYRHPGFLWRTAQAIFEAGKFTVPDDLRPLIARVYDDDDVPECLRHGQDRADGEAFGERNIAESNLIRIGQGYHEIGDLPVDQEIGTRLGEETATLRLARRQDGRLVPWAAPVDKKQSEIEDAERWALSEVSVREAWLGDAKAPAALTGETAALRAGWPEWEQELLVAVVAEDGPVALEGKNALFYSAARGLRKTES